MGERADITPQVQPDSGRWESNARALKARWMAAYMDRVPKDRVELVEIGPFTVLLDHTKADDWLNFALVIRPHGDANAVSAEVAKLRELFVLRRRKLRIEFDEGEWPLLGSYFQNAGLEVVERNPLMACLPDGFITTLPASGVTVKTLAVDAPERDLAVFQSIRWTEGTLEPPATLSQIEQLKEALSRRANHYAIAFLDGEPAGTGVLEDLDGVAEIVGIVTRPQARRRGVARAVTAFLTGEHFARGGVMAFLDASGDEAAGVYGQLGYKKFGDLVFYEELRQASR